MWKASIGTMRPAALTKSPRCALKAGTHQHGKAQHYRQHRSRSKAWHAAALTVKEEVEVLIAVKVQARVLTTGAIVPRWESSLARKQTNKQTSLWLDSFPLSHNPGLTPLTSPSHFEQVDHARSDVFDGHFHDDRFL